MAALPPGPTRRSGVPTLAAASLLLLLLLVCGLAAVYGYRELRRTPQSILANYAPLKETVVVRADGPTVVRQVQQLARLETSRYTMEKILDAERTRRYVPSFLAGEKLIFVAHGEVVAGVDLTQLAQSDVQVNGDAITLKLPKPQILFSRIDNEKSYVYERDTGVFSRPDKDLEGQVRATAEEQIRESAVEDGILDDARKNAEGSLRALLGSMGFTSVTFR